MIAIASQPPECEMANPLDRQMHSHTATSLATSKYTALRKLTCRVADGVVEITGSVPSFYLKQLAQSAILQLYPDCVIRNLVRVGPDATSPRDSDDCEG
jgi:hypothetical protein